MNPNEEFIDLVIREFQRATREGDEYTVPWLNLDVEAYRAYREGRAYTLPTPLGDVGGDPAHRLMMENAQGLNVLCLAGGGGQQSAMYGLLGAQVTVLDLMPSQLEADRQAAAHYGYPITTIQGDMHDLSVLPEAGFDRVHQPISTLYCYDLARLHAGVRRVLRPGGLYYADYAVPLLYMAQDLGWDGQGYLLRVREPYQRGAIRETPDGRVSFTDGQPIGEYHHLLSDIVNGLIGAGFALRGLWENPRPDTPEARMVLPEGKSAHRMRRLPYGISVVAQG